MSVFFSQKTVFKSWLNTSSIPCCLSSFFSFFLSQSRQLLDTWWIDWEWVCILDSFLTPGGSIKLLFLVLLGCSSTSPRHLSYQWPFSRHLPRQISRYLSTPASIEIYCWHYLSSLCNPELISLDLSLDTSLFSLPNVLISLQSLFLKDSSSFVKNFFTWQASNPFTFTHSTFWNLGFGVFEKFWGFSKLMSYYWNFGMRFHLNEFKISYIASH